jgi:hypothetical protein
MPGHISDFRIWILSSLDEEINLDLKDDICESSSSLYLQSERIFAGVMTEIIRKQKTKRT